MEGTRARVDFPEVEGCFGRVWDEHTCGVHFGLPADNHSVCGDPPNSHQLQAGQAQEGSSPAPLVVGATHGPGYPQSTWIERVMIQRMSLIGDVGVGRGRLRRLPPLRSVIPLLCGEYLCWVSATTACVRFSAVLILVVKILSGGGTSSELL